VLVISCDCSLGMIVADSDVISGFDSENSILYFFHYIFLLVKLCYVIKGANIRCVGSRATVIEIIHGDVAMSACIGHGTANNLYYEH